MRAQVDSRDLAPAGTGDLDFERVGERTVVRKAFARSPLRLLTPSNHGKSAWVYTSNFGGGFVGGDRFELRVRVRAEAEAVLLTQSTTKVYRSSLGASQNLEAEVEQRGSLLVVPDPVVCFEGASFSQTQRIHLEADASLLLIDAVNCGRCASGERWSFDRFHSQVRVWRKEAPVFFESLLLESKSGSLAERNGRFNTHCMVYLTGPCWTEVGQELLGRFARTGEAGHDRTTRRAGLVSAAGAVSEEGVLLRLAAVSTEDLANALREFLYFLPLKLGDNPWARKW